MRHRVYGKHLGRDKNQKTALFRGLLRSLILYGAITTTEAKAKAIKGLVDRLISQAKRGTPGALNALYSTLPQKEVTNKLLEKVIPSVKDRTSGFTSIIHLGSRMGDGAMMVKMSLIEGDKKQPEVEGVKKMKELSEEEEPKVKEKKTATVKVKAKEMK